MLAVVGAGTKEGASHTTSSGCWGAPPSQLVQSKDVLVSSGRAA